MLKTGEKKVSQAYYITFFKAWMAGWMVCFGAMVFQVCVGQTDTLRMTYPGLINLVGAFFFPVGLVSSRAGRVEDNLMIDHAGLDGSRARHRQLQ